MSILSKTQNLIILFHQKTGQNLSDVTAFEEFVRCDSELAACSLPAINEMIANEEISSEEEDQEYLISSDLNDKASYRFPR
ncbi:hypothetical protein AVEN_110160-1 [Araneus ventricosus]|uniref:Uncharacterized protein n=1 Tax=Araneus ventricosus TaxID=182803 RepID=A0A4Y2WY85_ARAVE|nr:hypothetical protein AVEN_110160-1 [Araneus ventricosus]